MMDLSFSFFLGQMAENPALLITVLLTLGVIAVNGITDAPNAIATCVSTRSMDVDWAIAMAALCNFAGVVFMTMINSTVAMTISNMHDIGSDFSKNLGRKEVFRFTLTKNRLKYTTKYSIYTTKWPFWNEM